MKTERNIKIGNQPKEITVTTEEMLNYYREVFDVIRQKYIVDDASEALLNRKKTGDIIIRELSERESHRKLSVLTKTDYGDVRDNLDMIYADTELTNNVLQLYALFQDKVVWSYLGIPGLERLFSEKYIDFEWEMHLGIDHQKHQMNFYRDHFVHQMRNAYSMHMLLKEFKWEERICGVLSDPQNSKISQFVYKFVQQQLQKGCWYLRRAKHPKLNQLMENRAYQEKFYYHNIIYMAAYMAALFHDIGYPEVNNAMHQRRIIDYIANLYNAEVSGYNKNRLIALLQNSLLFRVAPIKEIMDRVNGEKPDHGALSAIIFLMNFYENGSVQGLQPYEYCAVELAALAIYNHTNHYTYEQTDTSSNYIRCLFILNPISYLLRLCDDLQEWDRIYFEVSRRTGMILCDHCRTPIVRREDSRYVCNCQKEPFVRIFGGMGQFPYRRIYNVSVCDQLDMKREEIKGRSVLVFHLRYRLDRLLHMSYISPSYARHRIKELNRLKNLLDLQEQLPIMKVRYFVTANPILIRVQILKRVLNADVKERIQNRASIRGIKDEKQGRELHESCIREFDQLPIFSYKQNGRRNKITIDRLMEKLYPRARNHAQNMRMAEIRDRVRGMTEWYLRLYIFMEWYEWAAMQSAEDVSALVQQLDEAYDACILRNFDTESDIWFLLKDCQIQFERMGAVIGNLPLNPASYYHMFETDEYTYSCIRRYTDTRRYIPMLGDSTVLPEQRQQLDGFTDLAMIMYLLETLESGATYKTGHTNVEN